MQVTYFPGNALSQLMNYQRPNVSQIGLYGKLGLEDFLRVAEGLDGDIFSTQECVGFRKSLETEKPAQFSFGGHKVPLNRLLYHNFIDDTRKNDIIENSCGNKSTCCNIRHITKKTRKARSNPVNKLTDQQVITICHRLAANESASKIAKDFGVSRVCIHNIKKGKTHTAISKQII